MIISLSGKAKSGKDTVGEYLVTKHRYQTMSWAANLKEMCKKVFNLTDEQVYTQDGKEKTLPSSLQMNDNYLNLILGWMMATSNYNPLNEYTKFKTLRANIPAYTFNTPRAILQYVGTNICRVFYEKYHVEVVSNKLTNTTESNIVITDTRFPDELASAKNFSTDAITINIVRPGIKIAQSSHTSETALEGSTFDYVIVNDGTLEDLYAKVESILCEESAYNQPSCG